ncbi:1,4-dihydroxy-2-naphthoate polyprenyltransferase [Saprospiraceae bacterium]|nr:1,4-dihydroxy-2-naphthoate polyprenyltransferase [Saprospiraceae bacterium]
MIRSWIKAFRLRSLPLALACISMGSILAKVNGNMRWDIFILSLTTTIFLQILSNLANDYGDAVSGVDSDVRGGPKRSVQTGEITKEAMFRSVIVFSVLSLISGISLIILGLGFSWAFVIFLAIGLLAIAAAIKYTMGKNPYGYSGLGDISVFLFFGIIGVLGTYYLHMGTIDAMVIWPALTCSFFAVAVLNVNNIRDIESDKITGKISIPVRLGRDKAVVYHYIILALGLLSSIVYVLLTYEGPFQLLFLIIIPFLYKNAVAVRTKTAAEKLDPYLKQMALTTLLFVVSFGIGQLIY